MGGVGFFDSFRDVEVLQHRFFVLLIVAFTYFEWRVRATNWTSRQAAIVFPLLCAAGGTMLLTHSHAIANIKDQLLIELIHTPLALAGIAAGGARWLEIRLNPRENPIAWQLAGWVWPVCFLLCGLLLLGYREA
jgi:copper resistance protein D